MKTPDAPGQDPGQPFSREVPLMKITRPGHYDLDLQATPEELEALASFLGLMKLAKFSFRGVAEAGEDGTLRLQAKLGATVTQPCVITLAPVRTRLDVQVVRRFSKDWIAPGDDRQMQEDEDENLERLRDPLDFGMIAAEALALNLPPYPRAADAELGQQQFTEAGVAPLTDDDVKPFAGLAALKAKMEGGGE